MSRIKGMRDIITHGSLDRKERLFSVAKNMHQGVGVGRVNHQEAEDGFGGDVNRHIFKKPAPAKRPVSPAARPPLLDPNLIKEHLVAITRDLLEELLQAKAEKLPIANAELKRLNKYLKTLADEIRQAKTEKQPAVNAELERLNELLKPLADEIAEAERE